MHLQELTGHLQSFTDTARLFGYLSENDMDNCGQPMCLPLELEG